MFIVGATGDTVYQYDLSTAWDVSSASYNSVGFSVSSEENTPNGMCFSADGTYMYISGQNGDDINQYSLTSAWDVSTASFDNKTLSISSEETRPESVAISSDGTQMFILGQDMDKVHQYTLSTAYDISTGSLTASFTPSSTNPTGIAFKPDGTKFYIVGPVDDEIKQYSVFSDATVLLNFQDAGIYDRSGINNLDTVGNARLGFAPIYGTGSLAFDGTGDYLKTAENEALELESGDWTVEFWVNFNAVNNSTVKYLFDWRTASDTSNSFLAQESNNAWTYYNGAGSSITSGLTSSTFSASTWHHVAISRDGSTTRFFVDGTNVGSPSDSSNYDSGTLVIGSRYNGQNFLNGYIDDLRITKGLARYTSGFTPPTEIDISLDTHAEYVTLFLDGDGTVNGQNNTFTDSSTNDFTVTKNGSVAQGVFSPYGDNWSNYFDGTDYLYGTVNALGTGDFTLECWVNFSSLGANRTIMSFGAFSPALYYRHASTELAVYHGGAFYLSGFTPEVGEWYHVAFTRSGTTSRMFVNGTQQGSDTTYSTNITDTTLRIGYDTIDYTDAYISNVRVVKGTALYTSNFTAPTSPLSAVTNTEILTCQSNRFVDNGSNSITVSVNSTPQVNRFSPFESNKPYDITVDGGSGYFDDSSNSYLQIADNSAFDATTSLCIEAWFYMTSSPGSGPDAHAIVSKWVSTTPGQRTIFIDIENTGLRVYADLQGASNPVLITTDGGSISQHEWHHVAVTWDGSTYRAFLDGVLEGSTSSSSAPVASSQVVRVGHNTNTHYFGGYITDVRWVTDGGAIYTSAFTPPTSPLAAITNTELLLNFQDSAIPDLSGLNNIDTVGNAKVGGTDPTKYGSNAMQFDGSGDGVETLNSNVVTRQ
jgi:6-phosphogluconolactonase (cycloisomerase 2 family)